MQPAPVALLSTTGFFIALFIYLLFILLALFRLPWRTLAGERGLQHLLFGATVVLTLLWTLRAGISPGLVVHFIGITTLTLMFGWDLAIISGTLALLGLSVIGVEQWMDLPLNGLCLVVVPALVSRLILYLVERYLPHNFFVYMFLCAFWGGGIAAALGGITIACVLWATDIYDWNRVYHEYIRYLPLIVFPEGLLNGIIMTGMMVFYPDWIRTFDARIYIDEQ